ncbi:MAG: lipid-A-disaccharide synthase [Flavobacteriales bacterium]|nr:lipid-A-disaccharide synthase [Flavobacteriales bacterium]
MKYYIIAGEASGDLHASNLLKELRKIDDQAQFRAWGGDLMQEQGATIVKHYRELAFMGFTEVLMNLKTILRNMKFCVEDILRFKPDVVIMVDYPGFNLRVAKKLREHGIKVFYYISPQVWAWKQSRVKTIREVVDKMFVILPFEKEFYRKWNYEVEFVGHPLLDAIQHLPAADTEWKKSLGLRVKPIIALLPGSRKQEISRMLPIMLATSKKFPDYDFVIAGAPSQTEEYYRSFMGNHTIPLVFGKTYDILRNSEAALVTSGTATLETALLNIPEVVCYKGGKISYHIARRLIKVKFISLVNLIMDREVVKELIQDDFNVEQLSRELQRILPGTAERDQLLRDYQSLREILGNSGASALTASLMLKTLKS